jgi:hypothetical protein
LLHLLEPEQVIDSAATEALVETLSNVIASGALDDLPHDSDFAELSMSRMGFYGDEELARMVLDELKNRGLARETEDSVSIPMHRAVRSLYLVLLGQLVPNLPSMELLALRPVTDRIELAAALTDLLGRDPLPSVGHVVQLDIEEVGVDVSAVPFDDILAFKADHQDDLDRYHRQLRGFLRQLAPLSEEDRNETLRERTEEIRDAASVLRKFAHSAWGKGAGVGFGLAGATWAVAQHDPLAGLFAAGWAASPLLAGKGQSTAYSYLLQVGRSFPAARGGRLSADRKER